MSGIDSYQKQVESQNMDQFVFEYQPLVKKIALYMKRRLPSHIDLDDLLQSGFIGLLEAKKNYASDKGACFETFASIRIHGAIVDSLRKNSWASRDALKNMKRIADAISIIEQRGQKYPSNEEIANELGITAEEHLKLCQQISVCNVLNIDFVDENEAGIVDETNNPHEINQKEELISLIKEQITHLSEREQIVLSLYYIDEFTMKQIGEILELTEARICQIHSQAIAKLQSKLKRK